MTQDRPEVLDNEALLAWQSSMITEASELLNCGRTTAKALLAANDYSAATLRTVVLEAWTSSDASRKKLLQTVGVDEFPIAKTARAEIECGICWDTCPPAVRGPKNRFWVAAPSPLHGGADPGWTPGPRRPPPPPRAGTSSATSAGRASLASKSPSAG